MNEMPPPSKAELLNFIEQEWKNLWAYIAALKPDQLTIPTDAAGWTVKDHLMHLAVWEDGMHALLTGEPRHVRMGIEEAMWLARDVAGANAVIQQRHREDTLNDTLATLNAVHAKMMALLAAMPEETLYRPYSSFVPNSEQASPIIWWVAGNTGQHYAEHLPWMQAIANV
ncbi:MAG: DinB family protein [Aggregatilineales bacterium]